MQNEQIEINGKCICTGKVDMQIPEGGSHVRQAEIMLRPFNGKPTVVASISSPDSNGTMFLIWNVEIVNESNQTIIKFSAANVQLGVPSNFKFICSYIVTGKI